MLYYLHVVQEESVACAKSHLSDSMCTLWATAAVQGQGIDSDQEAGSLKINIQSDQTSTLLGIDLFH